MIRIVKLTFSTDYCDQFLMLFENRKKDIRNAEGCTHLALWRDMHTPHIFFTYSIWNNEESLEKYRNSPLFKETWQVVKTWFSEPPQAFSVSTIAELP